LYDPPRCCSLAYLELSHARVTEGAARRLVRASARLRRVDIECARGGGEVPGGGRDEVWCTRAVFTEQCVL